ncbi:hypothetical protein MIND_00955300 [Mycena indigotica]|uniref:Survival protein SurE-like phosphatase/nucleotidase domain-containing protein n=1 Tax=Mycena indigotica TaxID=2126181 RepID=A0A8H6SF54_9AGAR|nr:uncharacterized protein MIND_00955300 [Mycena indigotica]KAF7297222.1 hypothetical protein MIND_00955300 [Mycena indigotica]
MLSFLRLLTGALALGGASALTNPFNRKILLTNDDGWAASHIRASYTALKAAKYNVLMSAPAENKSGTGSSMAPPTVLNITCEFDTCPIGAPPEGFNASDPRLNYVNSFPATSVEFGIQTLSPKFFKSKPDFVFAGPNVGNNLGPTVLISGTVGAATEAALEGVPAIAFSGATGAQISYTTLANTTDPLTVASNLYAALSVKVVDTLLLLPGPILPKGIALNVNYPSTTSAQNCTQVSDFKFVLTRINPPDANSADVPICGSTQLPTESDAIATLGACINTISVFNASTKADVDKETQTFVLLRLFEILSCLPK